MADNKVLIVGTMAFDEVETPTGSSGKIIAGSATYIALATSFFDLESAIVSIVGRDFPQDYFKELSKRNINLEGVEIDNSGDTFYWKGRYHKNLNRRDTLATDLNTLANFNPIVPSHFKDSQVALLGNLHPRIQLLVLDQINTQKTIIILDTMNYWIERTWDELVQVVSKTDVITINDEEALQMTNANNVMSAAKKISDMGPSYVIIKKGEHGALLYHKEHETQVGFTRALTRSTCFNSWRAIHLDKAVFKASKRTWRGRNHKLPHFLCRGQRCWGVVFCLRLRCTTISSSKSKWNYTNGIALPTSYGRY